MAEKINIALSGLVVSIDGLRPDPKNARKHGKKSIEAIKESLTTYGQQKPIVAMADGKVIAGSGMFQAAEELGWTKIAVVMFSSTDQAEATAYGLVDNRVAEKSTWDEEMLKNLGNEIDLNEVIGFDQKFLKKYAFEKGAPQPDTKRQVQCPHCLKYHDLPTRKRKK